MRDKKEHKPTENTDQDNGDRVWSYVAISQETPEATRSWKKQGRILL